MSRGGKPIIALPSTAQGGSVSRIVPHLDEGAGVVTSRGDVHYVVTEFGVAYLHGKTIRERALALINIAHPDFRRELLDFVKGKHYVYEDEQVWEQAVNRYPADWETTFTAGGRELLVRPLRATDERLYQEFFYGHSPETVHERYFVAKSALSHPEAAHLCCVDWERRMAFGVFENRGPAERFVAVAQYELNPRTNRAEVGIVVREDWRRRGVARFLFERLAAYARSKGISGIHTEVLPTNQAMLALHRALGHRVRWDREARIYTVQHDLAEEPLAQPADAESPVGADDP
jgi:GNAT superfamily N-acetyltransferase